MNSWRASGVNRGSLRTWSRTAVASAGRPAGSGPAQARSSFTHNCRAADRRSSPRGYQTPNVPNPRNGDRPGGAGVFRRVSSPVPSGDVRSWATYPARWDTQSRNASDVRSAIGSR